MITYVNTVLVSNNADYQVRDFSAIEAGFADGAVKKGDFVIHKTWDAVDFDHQAVKEFRIGVVKGVNKLLAADGTVKNFADVKWSNEIRVADIKSFHSISVGGSDPSSEDTIEIDFAGAPMIAPSAAHDGGYNVVLRLTFKDLPTRYRNWTESYNYLTKSGDTEVEVAAGLASAVNKAFKRARVEATDDGAGKLTLVALKYTDDDAANTINWAGKVRFNANVWFTDPNAPAFMSNNKYSAVADDDKIVKTPGEDYSGKGKIVRDHENIAMGYQGILNQGPGTWPVIKPNTEAENDGVYDVATLEFENMYRAADDIFRKTKQTVEIYVNGNDGAVITDVVDAINEIIDPQVAEKGYAPEAEQAGGNDVP